MNGNGIEKGRSSIPLPFIPLLSGSSGECFARGIISNQIIPLTLIPLTNLGVNLWEFSSAPGQETATPFPKHQRRGIFVEPWRIQNQAPVGAAYSAPTGLGDLLRVVLQRFRS